MSCKQDKSFDIKTIDINTKQYNSWFDISEIYDAKFITLETTANSRIGIIQKILIHKNKIYIQDRQQNKILVFDMNGKYISSIGKEGKGKGEILQLGSFDIYNDNIYISSLMTNKMLVYDINEKLVREIKFQDYIGLSTKALKNGFISHTSNGSIKSATFYNKNGKKITTSINPKYNDLHYAPMNIFTTECDSTFMIFSNNDTIYNIKDNYITPHYYVYFNGKNIPIEELTTNEKLTNYKLNNNHCQIYRYFHGSPISYFLLVDDKKFCNVFYNLKNKKYNYSERISYKNFQIIEVIGEHKDGLVATWYPHMVPSYKSIENLTFDFIPDTCLNADINWNPGLVLLIPNTQN